MEWAIVPLSSLRDVYLRRRTTFFTHKDHVFYPLTSPQTTIDPFNHPGAGLASALTTTPDRDTRSSDVHPYLQKGGPARETHQERLLKCSTSTPHHRL